ncbi:MAG: hypothetical protein OXU77_20635 [Gammaproteobacteria bacterium]|nr:hypothetical protein [Gammaproteobacteria bacterium]
MELVAAYLALNQLANVEEALFACYQRDVGDEFLRAALFFHLLNQQQFASALELATDGGPDLRDEQVHRLFAKAAEFGEASQHYRWLATMLVEHKEFSARLGTISASYNPPTMNLAELIRKWPNGCPKTSR